MKSQSAVVVLFLFALSIALPALAGDTPESLIEAGHWKRARAIVEARVKANPNDAQALWMLSRIKEAFGDIEGALPPAEKAVALDGRNSAYHLQLGGVCGENAGKASMFKQISYGRRAKKELETALALDPKSAEALGAHAQFLWNAPGIFGGDKKQAHEVAKSMEQVNLEKALLMQAELAAEEKDTAGQEQALLKIVQSNLRSYLGLVTLAGYYVNVQKKYDLGEKYARQALAVDPDRIRAYNILAFTYAMQERWTDIDSIVAAAEKKIPDNLTPYYNAANALRGSGKDLPRAERYLRKYLSQEPEGRAPTQATAHWVLGLVLEKAGRKPEAKAEVEIAARTYPNNEQLKKDLDRLKR